MSIGVEVRDEGRVSGWVVCTVNTDSLGEVHELVSEEGVMDACAAAHLQGLCLKSPGLRGERCLLFGEISLTPRHPRLQGDS
jgi:hypothetical protein